VFVCLVVRDTPLAGPILSLDSLIAVAYLPGIVSKSKNVLLGASLGFVRNSMYGFIENYVAVGESSN